MTKNPPGKVLDAILNWSVSFSSAKGTVSEGGVYPVQWAGLVRLGVYRMNHRRWFDCDVLREVVREVRAEIRSTHGGCPCKTG